MTNIPTNLTKWDVLWIWIPRLWVVPHVWAEEERLKQQRHPWRDKCHSAVRGHHLRGTTDQSGPTTRPNYHCLTCKIAYQTKGMFDVILTERSIFNSCFKTFNYNSNLVLYVLYIMLKVSTGGSSNVERQQRLAASRDWQTTCQESWCGWRWFRWYGCEQCV